MNDCGYGWPVEDGLALFETAWDCPKLKRLSLDDFENSYRFDKDEPGEAGYVLSAPAPLGDEHVDGGDNQGQMDSDQAANNSSPQPETIVVQVASEQAFSEALARKGWAIDISAAQYSNRQHMKSSVRVIRDKLFDRVFGMPSMAAVNLEGTSYRQVVRPSQ